jgi:hypothetical protein
MAHSNYCQKEKHVHLILVWRYWIRCRRHVKFLEQGLIVLQVASTRMETQDTHKISLLFERLATVFDVFDMGMLKNTHKCQKSVQTCMYML